MMNVKRLILVITRLFNVINITDFSHYSFNKSPSTPKPVGPGMSTSTPMIDAPLVEHRTPMSGISHISKLSDIQPLPQSSGSSS